MKTRANGIMINYELSGSGDCLVLIHGAGHNLNTWYLQIPEFSQYYQVLAYDTRGHGETEPGEAESTQETRADNLHELLKILDIDKAYVLGHSMGGGIAATFALKYPETVKALILSNSFGVGPFSRTGVKQAMRDWEVTLALLDGQGMPGVVEHILKKTFAPGFVEQNPAFVKKYREIVLRTKAENYKKIIPMLAKRVFPDFTRLACPTLIIVGKYEGARGPHAARRVQKMIPSSELKIFPTGHNPFLEQPEAYNATVLRFLAKVRAG